jgi:NADH:ubiquinone oxidoreductase subunit 6 (subunit J)
MLSGAAALILLMATVLVAATGPAAAAIALGVVSTLVGVGAISFLIAWIVRTDEQPAARPWRQPSRPRPPPQPHPPRRLRPPRGRRGPPGGR